MKAYENIINFNELILKYYEMKNNSYNTFVKYSRNLNKSVFELNDKMYNYVSCQKKIANEIHNILQRIPIKYRKSLALYCLYLREKINYNQMLMYIGIDRRSFQIRLNEINKWIGAKENER